MTTSSTMSLDEEYFEWLCSQVRPRQSSKTYEGLLRLLYETEFVDHISNDDNRIDDAMDLFVEFFLRMKGLDTERVHGPGEGCSVLELLIGLSRRLAFIAGGEQEEWVWQLIENLGLDMPGQLHGRRRARARRILEDFIWRHYEPNGHGGLFPLRNPSEDQTKVEIWYQMHAYLQENDDQW